MKRDINKLYARRESDQQEHKCEVTDDDYKRIIPKIETISRLAEIESAVYAVYDLHKSNYLLQSEEQKKIYGLAGSKGQNVDSAMHYGRIHPDDLAFVLETDNMVYEFFSKLPSEEKKNYKQVYDFRTRTVDGFYVRHMHQSVAFELDKNGRTWLSLVISHLLPDYRKNEKPQRRLINFKTGKQYLFNMEDRENSREIISKREKEVLSLIGRGYDSINIAGKLNISVNTVNNHRQNILRKTRSDNTSQALMFCKRLGMI